MNVNKKHSKSYLIDSDDAPEITADMLVSGNKKIGSRNVSDEEFKSAVKQHRVGRPPVEKKKLLVSIRYDSDVIDYFKSGGKGWQTRINDVLRDYILRH